jgi:hypothetical protein
MNYPGLMRNAAKILFAVAAIVFVGTLLFAFIAVGQGAPAPGSILAGVLGAFTSAVPPFVGAAILWRLDIWLFERGDRK